MENMNWTQREFDDLAMEFRRAVRWSFRRGSCWMCCIDRLLWLRICRIWWNEVRGLGWPVLHNGTIESVSPVEDCYDCSFDRADLKEVLLCVSCPIFSWMRWGIKGELGRFMVGVLVTLLLTTLLALETIAANCAFLHGKLRWAIYFGCVGFEKRLFWPCQDLSTRFHCECWRCSAFFSPDLPFRLTAKSSFSSVSND